MLNIIVIESILDSIIDAAVNKDHPDDGRVEEEVLEVIFCIFTGPQYAFVKLGEDLNRFSIQFVEDRLVQRIHL